ncbi:MAG: polymorphic toxin type 44 domain-containing protein [Pseudomonadales bacterium]|nr:polymorphic toxin type 44 domain-containing protein [Pseudomonadales bacterium]
MNIESVVGYILSEMLKNIQSPIAQKIKAKNKETLGFYEAATLWKSMVGNRKPWDHKQHIKKTYGEWSYDKQTKTYYNFDIWSNLHYGYVGRYAGFSAWTLKAGAGYAQWQAGTSPPGYWERRLKEIGDADFLAAFDDPHDQTAIQIGADLWDAHQQKLTIANILKPVRNQRKQLQTK